MKIVEPKVYVEKFDGLKIMKNIELACRTCYRSEGQITEDSYKKLLQNCINRGHESVLEHEKITIRMICDIGVYKDLTRHRFGSFSIESTRYCVAGDTRLKFLNGHSRYTIKEMYEKMHNSKNGQWKRMKIKHLNESTGEFDYATIKNLFYNGKKKCYKIKTDLGYELICTVDHKIYTPQGYKKLEDLVIGDKVYINGQDADEPLYRNHDWMYYQYVTLNKSYSQIANEFNFKLATVKKWGHKLNMPYKGCGYANVGKSPWNKGLTENDNISIKAQADSLRRNRYDRWKKDTYETAPDGSVILERTPRVYKKYRKNYCQICSRTDRDIKLEVHHKDGDHDNFDEDNFITLCPKCHQGIENKSLNILHADIIVDIEDVGEVDVYDLEVNSEYHNFVANGVIVHNCNYGKDKFENEIKFIKPIFWKGDEELFNADTDSVFMFSTGDDKEITNNVDYIQNHKEVNKAYIWYMTMKQIEQSYMKMSKLGCTPDEMRMILPHSTAAEVTMTCNIREWKHILELRANKFAHPSVQQVMIPIAKLFKEQMPEIFNSLEYNENFNGELASISFDNKDI